jgi:hypothetical protein
MKLETLKSKIILISISILLFIAFKYYMGSNWGWKNYFLNLEYEGTIRTKMLDSNKRFEPAVMIEGNSTSFLIENMNIYDLIQPGDYIIKRKWTTKHILIRQRDTILFFPEIGGKFLINQE